VYYYEGKRAQGEQGEGSKVYGSVLESGVMLTVMK